MKRRWVYGFVTMYRQSGPNKYIFFRKPFGQFPSMGVLLKQDPHVQSLRAGSVVHGFGKAIRTRNQVSRGAMLHDTASVGAIPAVAHGFRYNGLLDAVAYGLLVQAVMNKCQGECVE